jgi:hypothetical protein
MTESERQTNERYKCRWCEERFKNEQDRTGHHLLRKHWLERP